MKRTFCIYSDESGVFDKIHDDIFVFGGIILNATVDEVSKAASLYKNIENTLRKKSEYNNINELKAVNLSFHDRRWVFSKLTPLYKFGTVIELQRVKDEMFINKKIKQRYQDFAYKLGVKNAFESMLKSNLVNKYDELRFEFFVDAHHTATDGRYELHEALLQEFKDGTVNYNTMHYFPPLFPNTVSLNLHLADSKTNLLVRTADIVANRIYYETKHARHIKIHSSNPIIKVLP